MATFRKRTGKWQARVQRTGQSPLAKSFNTKAEAIKWARHTESQLDLGTLAPKAAMPPLMRIVDRYLAEVTPTKKGSKQELNRGRQIARTALGLMQLDKITNEVVSKYRDGRLRQVSNNTVRLELAFISVVFEQCAKEWGESARVLRRQNTPRGPSYEQEIESFFTRGSRACSAHGARAQFRVPVAVGCCAIHRTQDRLHA